MSDSPPTTEVETPTEARLLRALGLPTAMAIVVGNVIGSGIFLKPGEIAAGAGDFTLIISVWVAGGLLCLLGALCFAELAAMLPHAGGMYVYLKEAYGKLPAFLFGWNDFLFNRPGSIAALAVAFVGSLAQAAHWQPSAATQVVLAMLLIAGLAWVNIMGVVWGGHVQNATTLVKVGFLALMACVPFVMNLWQTDAVEVANYSTHLVQPLTTSLSTRAGLVLLAVMWAYNGWHQVAPVAEEIRDPQRNIPKALVFGVLLLILLYVSVNVAYHGVLSMQEMSTAGQHAAELMLGRLFGPVGITLMATVIMCSTFGALNSNTLVGPRITYAMGRDRMFFRALSLVHVNFHTPVVAILVQAAMAMLLILAAAVAKWMVQDWIVADISGELPQLVIKSLQSDSIFTLLTNFVIFAASCFYSLAVLAVLVLRFRRPDLPRPYRTWGYPLPPVLFLLVYAWFLYQTYLTRPLESNLGMFLIALGIPFYFYWANRQE